MCWFVIFYTDHQLPTWEEVANVCVRTGVVWVVWTGGAGVLSGFDGWQGGQGGEQFVLCYRESHSYLFLLCSTTTCGAMTSRKKRGKPVPSGVNRERSEAALKIMADSINTVWSGPRRSRTKPSASKFIVISKKTEQSWPPK